jgi:hypothetical protein
VKHEAPSHGLQRVIPPEEDTQRLFQECHIANGNAQLLNETLTFTSPQQNLPDPYPRTRMGLQTRDVHYSLTTLINCDQVFEETSTFRGEMKTLARQIVESEYDIFVPVDVGHNSEDAVQYTADRVEHYLTKGRFLRDVNFDAEVSVY